MNEEKIYTDPGFEINRFYTAEESNKQYRQLISQGRDLLKRCI